MKTFYFRILLLLFCIIGIGHFGYAQSTNNKQTIVDKSGKYKDSITTHIWNPLLIADSLLFDGIQQYTFPESSITYTPPKTFRLDEQGNIVHDWTGSSIQSKILNTNYSKLIPTITKETFEKQGFSYINQLQITTDQKNEGTLFLIKFTSNNIEYERIVFFVGNQHQTLWLNINYPVMMKSLLYEVFEKSLLTIKL